MEGVPNDSIIDIFTQISLFRTFSASEIQEKFFKKGLAKIIEYRPGETIIDEGKYDNWVFWLIEGRIDIVKTAVTVATFQRVGDMFGEMGILEGDARSASVIACTPTTCLTIDMSILDHPDIKHKISQEAFCRDVAQITKTRLARTTSRLSESAHELELIKHQLAEYEKRYKEAMQTIKKTLLKLDEKDHEILSLRHELDTALQELRKK